MNRAAVAVLLLLAGCANPVSYERPPVELPAAWKESAPAAFAEDGRWWRIYNDADLEVLVEEAFARNTDMALALARVEESRAIAGEVESFLYPEVGVGASAGRDRFSEAAGTLPPGFPRERTSYRASLNVSYEIDLWGRARAAGEAARAELLASEAARDTVRLALAAQVVKSWYALRSLDARVELQRQTLQLRQDAYTLQKKRRDGGVISEFELYQLDAEVQAVRAQLPALEREREAEEAALAVLLGRNPRAIFEDLVARPQTPDDRLLAAVVPSGLPSELLLRRPDLLEAEQQLVAAEARIAVARAAYFPSIALTAQAGGASVALGDLFTGAGAFWGIAASIAQPIFEGGRLRARTAQAEARERQALARYQRSIQEAFREVRTALVTQVRAREAYEAHSARAVALGETLRLARLRYASGVASQLDLIDAERGRLDAESARIEALRVQRAAVADLFRALGG